MKRRANINSYFQRRQRKPHRILIAIFMLIAISGAPNHYIETATVNTAAWKIEQVPHDEIAKPKAKHKLMDWAIRKYACDYDVPEGILRGVAFYETGYQGPEHVGYNPHRVSSCGAVGPMQIMPRYASKHAGKKVTAKQLKYDIELNVKVSASMLSSQFRRYGSWKRALGAYSTGKPIVNRYALKVVSKWLKS